jgi:hypothetical protein
VITERVNNIDTNGQQQKNHEFFYLETKGRHDKIRGKQADDGKVAKVIHEQGMDIDEQITDEAAARRVKHHIDGQEAYRRPDPFMHLVRGDDAAHRMFILPPLSFCQSAELHLIV